MELTFLKRLKPPLAAAGLGALVTIAICHLTQAQNAGDRCDNDGEVHHHLIMTNDKTLACDGHIWQEGNQRVNCPGVPPGSGWICDGHQWQPPFKLGIDNHFQLEGMDALNRRLDKIDKNLAQLQCLALQTSLRATLDCLELIDDGQRAH